MDIETAPAKAYVWGLFGVNIGINQIVEPGSTLCFAAKWLGEKEMVFKSVHHDNFDYMLATIYKLLDEADAVIHYNGVKFDIPVLNREFVAKGWAPPAPFVDIDLYRTVRSRFKFLSNKLDFVAQQLLGDQKEQHKGMGLWTGCMNGVEADWDMMKKYNIQDVALLEKLYVKLLPWIQPHPNHGLYNAAGDKLVCPNCGGIHLNARGFYNTQTMRYQRYQCKDCGKWSKARVNNLPKEQKANILAGVR